MPCDKKLNDGRLAEREDEKGMKDEKALEAIETLVAELRAHPGRFPDVAALGAHSGLGEKRVVAWLRRHYHATPEDMLRRARLDAAKQALLKGTDSRAKIVGAVGYASATHLENDFKMFNGMGTREYRTLGHPGRQFFVRLPADYPLGYLRRALSRDRHSVTERWEGDVYSTAVLLGGHPFGLTMTFARDRVLVSLDAPTMELPRLHALIMGMLGLEQAVTAFGLRARALDLGRLVEGRPQLRVFQTPTLFDGLLWAIVGQQINLQFACRLRGRLMEKRGVRAANGLYVPPTPQAVAALEPRDLLSLQYSRQKADYLLGLSRTIAEGKLDLEALRAMSATRAERTLLALRGFGPWSVNYVMMRSLGFADCLPLGDTGVTSGLVSLFRLKQRPNVGATRRLMARFSPYRSLATAHLWQLDRPAPEMDVHSDSDGERDTCAIKS